MVVQFRDNRQTRIHTYMVETEFGVKTIVRSGRQKGAETTADVVLSCGEYIYIHLDYNIVCALRMISGGQGEGVGGRAKEKIARVCTGKKVNAQRTVCVKETCSCRYC